MDYTRGQENFSIKSFGKSSEIKLKKKKLSNVSYNFDLSVIPKLKLKTFCTFFLIEVLHFTIVTPGSG